MDGAVRKIPDLYRKVDLLHNRVVPDDMRTTHLAVGQLNSRKIRLCEGVTQLATPSEEGVADC